MKLCARAASIRSLIAGNYLHGLTDPVTNEFLRQRVGLARLNEIYATEVPGAIWQVRYFRDSQPEEFSVKLKPDGSLAAFNQNSPRMRRVHR